MKGKNGLVLPSLDQLEMELEREIYRQKYRRMVRSTLGMLTVAAAAAVLIATLLLPVLRIYGASMEPVLMDGDVVVAVSGDNWNRGDVIAFYYNNEILVKRIIGLPGEWIDMEEDGTVLVNGEALSEPYLSERALGVCDLELPYQVPEGEYFVMGDHRSVSVDSRSAALGGIAQERIIGKLFLRVWPLDRIGGIP